MNIELRDPQFSLFVNSLAEAIELPEITFGTVLRDATRDTFKAIYEVLTTPDRVKLQQALRGIAI